MVGIKVSSAYHPLFIAFPIYAPFVNFCNDLCQTPKVFQKNADIYYVNNTETEYIKMLKINPKKNFVFKPEIQNQDNNKIEVKKATKTYVPKVPNIVEIEEQDTPL